MGTFLGHVVAGVMFAVLSIVWLLGTWYSYFQSRCSAVKEECHTKKRPRKSNTQFESQISFTFPCCPRVPFDGIYKVVAAILGVVSETVPVWYYNLPWISHTFHHVTMYSFFGLSGAVDLMVSVGVPLPPGTDYAAFALSFVIEGLLFYYHVLNRTPLDSHVHILLVMSIVSTVFATIVEMKLKHQPLPVLLRSMTVMVQGTWLIHIGFILFNPIPGYVAWNLFSVDAIMMVTVYFCIHVSGAVLFAILSGLLVLCCCNRKSRSVDCSGSYALIPTHVQDSEESPKDTHLANGKNKMTWTNNNEFSEEPHHNGKI